jgi:hypothetical protein
MAAEAKLPDLILHGNWSVCRVSPTLPPASEAPRKLDGRLP